MYSEEIPRRSAFGGCGGGFFWHAAGRMFSRASPPHIAKRVFTKIPKSDMLSIALFTYINNGNGRT